MEILLTNHHLNLLGGSETFTYTLAQALRKAGHSISILTAEPGAVSEILAKDGFVVTINPGDLVGQTFDIIHCHHNTMALVARAAFPDTPVVFLSHGIVQGLEEPPSINLGIGAFIGVSEEIQANLIQNYDVNDPRIIRNGVDCERFSSKKQINEKLKNVLILSNHFPAEQFAIVKSAAAAHGATTRLVGLSTGSVWQIEDEINNADLVVSLGRGVLEAMACERAVLVYDWHGGDGMLTAETYPEVRKHNFSGRRFAQKYDLESLINELKKYDPAMGKTNRDIVLKHHNIDQHVSVYQKIYQQAIQSWKPGTAYDTPGREILFYQSTWRERSQILQQAVQLECENIKLKEELANFKPRLAKMMEKIQSEQALIDEEKRALGIRSGLGIFKMKRSTTVQELKEYTGKNLVFIFGPPRSGTTWVFSLFREHPDVVVADVDNLDIRQGDDETLETGIFLDNKMLNDSEIRKRFHQLSQENPDKVIIEKTPIHVFMASRMVMVFPEAAFILLTRDGRDVVTSMINVARKQDAWWRGAPTKVADATEYWRKFAEKGYECERQFSPYVIKYEDLLQNPLAELACMTKAFGLSMDHLEEQVEAARGGKNIPIKGVFRKGATGDWRNLFTSTDVETFKSVAGEMLISLGYEKDNNWTL